MIEYKKPYKHYDIAAIKERLSVEEICDNLGLRRKAGQCQCPSKEHQDTHFGNCLIKTYGCYCFACQKKFDKIAMVQENKGTGFYETLEVMASWAGVEADANMPAPRKRFPLSDEEVELLGLLSTPGTVSGVCGVKPWEPNLNGEKRFRDINGDLYVLSNKTFSLKQLYWEDETSFRMIVLGKAKEKVAECNDLLKNCPEVMKKNLLEIRQELLGLFNRLNAAA